MPHGPRGPRSLGRLGGARLCVATSPSVGDGPHGLSRNAVQVISAELSARRGLPRRTPERPFSNTQLNIPKNRIQPMEPALKAS
jgi:hypothetical protein